MSLGSGKSFKELKEVLQVVFRLEAVIYLGDTSLYVSSRPGSNATKRPWLRSQERGHLSFYFPEPPDFLMSRSTASKSI